MKLSVEQTLKKAKSHIKKGDLDAARGLYQSILETYPKNKSAGLGLAALNKPDVTAINQNPPQEITNQLVNLYNQGQLVAALEQAQELVQQYPSAFIIWNIMGAAAAQTGRLEEAVDAFKKVTVLNP
ncbi:MAG: tetratricopeptide repeat protein, partial [Gammaproteobacteria bacterium]|nr:tetratricopeptide repeat protein [Gammaproteobacteria bacterium]